MGRGTSFEDMDLPAIAVHARWALALIAAYIVLIVLNLVLVVATTTPAGTAPLAVNVTVWVLWLGLLAGSIAVGVLLMRAMRLGIASIVLWSVLMVPFSFLVLVALYSQASTTLKVLGIKPGFFGVGRADRERIMPGRCRRCGYDRSGLEDVLAPCPECSRVPIVW